MVDTGPLTEDEAALSGRGEGMRLAVRVPDIMVAVGEGMHSSLDAVVKLECSSHAHFGLHILVCNIATLIAQLHWAMQVRD